MIEHSPTISELAKALHGAQGVLTGVFKDKVNPAFKSRYANLERVLDTIRPGLQENGLAVMQAPGRIVDGCLEVSTMILHTSGEWWRATTQVPLVKRDPQGMGSATTYGLRYSLMAALGVPPSDDDDGEAAGKAPAEPSFSQVAASVMIEALNKRAGSASIEAFLAKPAIKRDLDLMEVADHTRVMKVAAQRKAAAPAQGAA